MSQKKQVTLERTLLIGAAVGLLLGILSRRLAIGLLLGIGISILLAIFFREKNRSSD